MPIKHHRGCQVTLLHGVYRGTIVLNRQPRFLRFTVKGAGHWETLDALDQFDDEPLPDEMLLAAERYHASMMHVLMARRQPNGCRGMWIPNVTYHSVPAQPSQEVMRDTTLWREWTTEAAKQPALEHRKDEI